jgi:hypothetical protein
VSLVGWCLHNILLSWCSIEEIGVSNKLVPTKYLAENGVSSRLVPTSFVTVGWCL